MIKAPGRFLILRRFSAIFYPAIHWQLSRLLSLLCISLFASAPLDAELRSSITQYGVTWNFNGTYECGQFVTGDWWVVGPVTITSVTPSPSGSRNGSALNPMPLRQGYDSRGGRYDTTDNITFPATIQPNNSLVSSVSKGEGQHSSNAGPLQSQALLTIVADEIPSGTLRPAYSGTYKQYFNISEINWSVLPNVTAPVTTPAASTILPYLEMPRIDHVCNWQIQYSCAEDNWNNGVLHPCYGRDLSALISKAAMYVMLDTPDRDELALEMIQNGIDNYAVIRAGGNWFSDGGHNSGRKFPIVFAAILLDDADMLDLESDYPDKFGEDGQTYYGNNDKALFGRTCSSSYFPSCDGSGTGAKDCKDPAGLIDGCDDYRNCCTSRYWVGQMLATLFIGGKEVWGHDPYFDYVDRWMESDVIGGGASNSTFINDLWFLYRDDLPEGSGGTGITITASSHDGNIPANAMDDNLSTRWSAHGNGEWIQFELDEVYTVTQINLAFFVGDQRYSIFDLEVSLNGSDWTTVYSGQSGGTSLNPESFDISDSDARFVRYVGYGNSVNSWNSLTEVEIEGYPATPPTGGSGISEDFSGSAADFSTSGGTWNVSGGRYILSNPATGGIGLLGNISVHDTAFTADYILSGLINITGTSADWNDAAMVFGYQDTNNYYYFSLNESNDGNTQGLFKVVNGTVTELADLTTTIVSDTDYVIEIMHNEDLITVKLDGVEVATSTDTTFSGGKVGFGSRNDSAQFDNLYCVSTRVLEITASTNDQEIWDNGGTRWDGQAEMRVGRSGTVVANPSSHHYWRFSSANASTAADRPVLTIRIEDSAGG